ncbi:hypothetical protein ACFLTM_02840 [Candidatus Bipolaricaulota bacterium]
MSRSASGRSLGQLLVDAGRLIGEHPIILIPAVIPSFWAFIAPYIGLLSPAILTTGYFGLGFGAWRTLVFLLIYVPLLILSQSATVILVRAATQGDAPSLQSGLEESISRFVPLFTASMLAGIIVALASLVFIFPALVAVFFLWYIVQVIIVNDESALGALRASFGFSATYAGETFAIVLAALVISFAFSYIPVVGPLLMIPTTSYFVALTTLFYLERAS